MCLQVLDFKILNSYALLILGESLKSKSWSSAWKIRLKISKLAHASLVQLVKNHFNYEKFA